MIVNQLGPTGDVAIERTGDNALTVDVNLDVEGLAVEDVLIEGVPLADYVKKAVAEALKK